MLNRSLIRWGALAGALVAIGTLLSSARPLVMSEPPPWPNLSHIHQEEVEIAGLVQTNQQTQQYLKAMQQNVLFLAQQNWTLVQSNAQDQLRRNPNNSAARQQLNTANQALYGIQRQLYGGK